MITLLLLMSGTALIVFISNQTSPSQTDKTLYQVLEGQRFFHVTDAYAKKLYGSDAGMSFDLKHQALFGSDIAIKDKQLFGNQLDDLTVEEYYNSEVNYSLEATKEIAFDKAAIQREGYQQTLELKEVWKHLKKTDSACYILDDFQQSSLLKLRISYNKKFLPVKIEGFYKSEDEKGWVDLFYINYPYKNQQDFNQQLDAYISSLPAVSEEEAEDD
ncbi:hypothetical protein [Streptococcus sp. DD11]|uniref:hypothetical protein n=1 Tax=Streptococcus sp. DD11 TaxID=1777879 RepID=UPI001F49E231|nr:hypothetical protein [Streptococcus sp. DD11]